MANEIEGIEIHHDPVNIGQVTPEVAEIMRELDQPAILASLRDRIAEVAPMVARAADEAEREARAGLEKSIEAGILRDAPARLEDAWRRYDAALAKVRGDHQLSDRGRGERVAAMEAQRDEDLAELHSMYDGHASALVTQSPPPRPPAITPDVGSHVSVVMSTFGPMLPEDFVRGALDALAVAVDPTEPPEVREAHTAILAHGYAPLIKRRAVMPERFAEPYRPIYAEVRDLVQDHIAARAAKHRAATAIRDEFRGIWRTLITTAQSTGKWDGFIADIATGR